MRRILVVALAMITGFLALSGFADPASAQKRVALVVGNSDYRHAPKLTNPKNDATDVAAALMKIGFQVVEGLRPRQGGL
jgi:Caspase domain